MMYITDERQRIVGGGNLDRILEVYHFIGVKENSDIDGIKIINEKIR